MAMGVRGRARRVLVVSMGFGCAMPLLAGLDGCSALAPSSIDVDQGQLDAAINRRFPYQTRWLGVFDVNAAAPQLRLLPERNRIATDVSLKLGERLSGHEMQGALSFESGLRYEPGDRSLRLTQVSVDKVAFAGLPDALAGETARLGAVLARQLLEDAVLYKLDDAQQATLDRYRVRPGELRVTPRGLNIALVPAGP